MVDPSAQISTEVTHLPRYLYEPAGHRHLGCDNCSSEQYIGAS